MNFMNFLTQSASRTPQPTKFSTSIWAAISHQQPTAPPNSK